MDEASRGIQFTYGLWMIFSKETDFLDLFFPISPVQIHLLAVSCFISLILNQFTICHLTFSIEVLTATLLSAKIVSINKN